MVGRQRNVLPAQFPVFWVEGFSEAYQKWVSVDPLSTSTVGKPHKVEPPLNHPENTMSYVIAFEDDGTAKDVTRRYVKAFNAKTRKLRVEATDGGERWWSKTMRGLRRRRKLVRLFKLKQFYHTNLYRPTRIETN